MPIPETQKQRSDSNQIIDLNSSDITANSTQSKQKASVTESMQSTKDIQEFVEAINESCQKINHSMLLSGDAALRSDWADHYEMIDGNLKYIKEKSVAGSLDQILAKKLLEMVIKDLANWNDKISRQSGLEAAEDKQQSKQYDKTNLPLILPGTEKLQKPVVVMDYRDAIALNYFKQYGIPLLENMWPDIESLLYEVGSPDSQYKKSGGLVPEISRKMTEGKGGIWEARQEHLRRQREEINRRQDAVRQNRE